MIATEKLTEAQILEAIKAYEASKTYSRLKQYQSYYEAKNADLLNRWVTRETRRKTPNWYVPSAYFSTVIDTMAGYMFQDVQYSSANEDIQAQIRHALDMSSQDVKDMVTGTTALAYNRAYELVYTEGDSPEVKYALLPTLQCIPIYDDKLEPDLFGLIWKRTAWDDNKADLIDVIYADEWQYYRHRGQEFKQREASRRLYYPTCPVIEYRTEIIGDQSPFHVVIPYISALDWAITGNSNEIDRIVDALLLLGRRVQDEDLMHMDEWKILEGIEKDELKPEYLTKNLSPEFRKYVTDLLINEIHKHSHVVDWYNAESGASGEASGRALRIRLFDMDSYSKRIEKVFIRGIYKRIDLMAHMLGILKGMEREPISVTLNRTMPSDVEEKMESLKGVDWYSTQTKVEMTGGNWETEQVRLAQERPELEIDTAERGEFE